MATKPPIPPKRHFNQVPTSTKATIVDPHLNGEIKNFNIQGLKLPSLAVVQVKVRQLSVQRNIAGDFGFTIRRVQYPTGIQGELRTVVFVEPTNTKSGPPRPDDVKNNLLPGDELLEIGGRPVAQMSREELHDAVRNADPQIVLKVKTAPELAEFCDKQSSGGVRDRGDTIQLSNVNTSIVEDIPEDCRYWLVHKGGYTMARLEEFLPDGRVRIAVAGQHMVVDSTDVDRANPVRFDRVADSAALPFLNETATIHLLRQRFGGNLLYTNAGSQSVICLNSADGSTLSDDRLVSLFKGCRRGHIPSHIYGTAQHLYRNIQMTGQDQALVLTGATGSGKSSQLRNLTRYLSHVAGWTKQLTYNRISLIFGVLEAFGNCVTDLNPSATRFAALYNLEFDKAAALRTMNVHTGMLQSELVMRRAEGETLFHVFYYLLEGADQSLRSRLQLSSLPAPTISPYKKTAERENAALAWNQLLHALKELNFNEQQVEGICSILGALLHLHAAEATPGSAQKSHFLRAANAQAAASLLGISVEALANVIFRAKLPSVNNNPTIGASLSRMAFTSRGPDGPEALVSFGAALYNELFTAIVEHVNKNFSSTSTLSRISVLDIPGSNYHSEWTSHPKRGLGLNDLIFNYANERVSELFYDCTFTEPQEVYSRENVDVNVQHPIHRPHTMNRLLDQKQQLLASTDIDERSEEKRGIFPILEEEAMFPGASDESFLQRIFVHLGDDSRLISRGETATKMVLSHGMGTHRATYSVDGWIKQAQPVEGANLVRPLLSSTSCPLIASLYVTTALPAEASRLRRATQVAQLELMSKRTSHGVFGNVQGQLEQLLKSVKRATHVHFVHCILPTASVRTTAEIMDVPFVRCQLRTVQLIEAIRANNRGYPERISFRDFRRRFSCLAGQAADRLDALDDRAASERILVNCDIHQHRYRLGISQLLLASDLLVELEDKRELSLGGLIESLQRECRRHLATKWLQKRRMLESAIRCIQRNGQSYMKTRNWAWWRLYMRVVPLINVARNETDVTDWRRRVDELTNQVMELRSTKSKAERKVDELEQMLSEHANTASVLTTALERENENRVHLERRIQVLNEQGSGSISRVSSSAKLDGMEDKEKVLKTQVNQLRAAEEDARAKAQRAVAQLQDLEGQLNQIRARNDVLEKKQNRFDEDMAVLKEQVAVERTKRETIENEKDELKGLVHRKTTDLQTSKSEVVELRAVVARLRRETEERDVQSGNEEIVQIQKVKRDLEQKVQAQDVELNELADQNHVLQQSVTRLEMNNERVKTDLSRETASREMELEEMRSQYQRRIRGMEEQLADVNDKYQSLLAENRVIVARMRQKDVVGSPIEGGHYKRELRKALALLADTQAVLAHERDAAPSQSILRQLRNQLEDTEAAKTSALKGKHNLESELNEVRSLLEATLAAKTQLEERCLNLLRDKNAGCALVEEKDEQLQAALKKYRGVLQDNHILQITNADHIEQMSDLEKAKHKLEEEVHDLKTEIEWNRQHTVEKHKLLLCEQKLKDTENRLELEIAHKLRLESMVVKLTDEVESLTEQTEEAATARDKEQETTKKTKKEVVMLQETIEDMKKKGIDQQARTKSARSETEQLEEQLKTTQAELKLAQRRIEALHAALNEGLDTADGDSDDEDLNTGMAIL